MSRWEWPPDGWYRREAVGFIYFGWVIGMLTALAWMLLAGGCAASKPPASSLPGVLPVAVVSWPAPIRPQCDTSELPQIPDVFIWTKASEEESTRIYITQRQLADLVVWFKDVKQWADLQTACLGKLTAP